MNFFSKNLKTLRKHFKITQGQLALQINKGQTTIGNWENGYSEPNINDLMLLSNFFGLNISLMLGEEITDAHLIGHNTAKYSTSGLPETVANEPDNSLTWLLAQQVRQLTEKIEQLQLSVDDLKKKMS